MTKESNTSCNHISNFQEDVMKHIKNLISQIKCTTEQKKIILSKSEKILKTHISRSEKGGVNISSYMKPISLAVAIIYTIVVSNENMPKISSTFLANFANLASSVAITKYYRKHFQEFYHRSDFSFTIHKFGRIRLIFSNYIFKLIKSKKIETSEIIFHLKEKVLKKINLPNQLNEKDVETLFKMATQYEDTFIKYFSDLAEIIKQLIISSNVHKKIGAHLIINNIAELLKERGIHLFTPSELSKAMVEIFDFLKKNNPIFFSNRAYTQDADIYRNEYAKIVGSKLKIFMMKNMYNGKYFHNGIVKCPQCLEEGLIINTDISRLKSLQFHHPNENKKT